MGLSENVKKFFNLPNIKYILQHEDWDSFFTVAERHSRELHPTSTLGMFTFMREIVIVAGTLDKDCIDKVGFLPTGFAYSRDSEIIDLTSITGISKIHQAAFLYPGATIVIIPNNITSIDSSAFYCNHSIRMIYKGTMAEFDAKLKANMNSYIIGSVCCSDGCIQL